MADEQDSILKTLQEMRDEYWQSIENEEENISVETRDFVVVELSGERFGFPSSVAREVLKIPRLVRVPRVAEHILGVINLRGQVVAVTDLRPLLGLAGRETSPSGRLVVVEAAGVTSALLVEKVVGISVVAVDNIEPLTEGLSGFSRDAADGQVETEEGLLVLLNMEQIFSRPEFLINQKNE